MDNLQIVGLGLSNLDVLARVSGLPAWGRDGTASEIRFDGGGPVGTALTAAARLGARVGFVGTAGNDDIAGLRVRMLVREGIDISRLIMRQHAEDQVVLVFVHAETGERVFLRGLAGTHRPSPHPLRVEELDREYITSAEYLHLDGFHAEAAAQAARWMHEAGKKVVLDAAKTRGAVKPWLPPLVELADILICGSGFAPALTGVSDIGEAGRRVLAMGPSIVVQTEGEAGSYTTTATEEFHTPAFPVQVVDTTGAGDVFHGAYLVGLLHGWGLRRIATFASAASAIKCTRLGGRAGIPSYTDVLAFLRKHARGWE